MSVAVMRAPSMAKPPSVASNPARSWRWLE